MPDSISGLTKNEIITAAIFPLGYSSSDITGDLSTHLSALFDDALLDFCQRNDWRFLHTKATISLSQGVRTYDFQSNSIYVDKIERLFITTTGKSGRIYKTSYQRIINNDPEETGTGTPRYYAEWGDQTIYFDVTTDQAYTGKVYYKQKPPMVTDSGGYTIVPRDLKPALVLGLKWKLAADKGDRRKQEFEGDYEKKVFSLITNENTYLESGDDSIEMPQDSTNIGGAIPSYEQWLGRVL